MGKSSYLLQLLQNSIIHTVLFEINAHRIDNLLDDVVIDVADGSIRHVDERRRRRRWFADLLG